MTQISDLDVPPLVPPASEAGSAPPADASRPAAASQPTTARSWTLRAGLIWTLVRTDFKARYHGTLGGFVWALLKPACMFVVLMAVFSFLFVSSPTYKLDLIIGLFLWEFFSEGTKAGLASLHTKGFLLTKARFPSWIIVVSSISNALITLAVFCGVISLFLIGAGRPPTVAGVGLFLFYAAALTALVIAFSLAASVLFLRYRDLNQVWDVAVQAGFFLAPVIYPLEILPERFHLYLYAWPPTPVIEFSRAVLVDAAVPTLRAHVGLVAGVGMALLVGILIFRRLSPRAAEYL